MSYNAQSNALSFSSQQETEGEEREAASKKVRERKREVAPDKQRRLETKENATHLGRGRELGKKYWGC